MYVCIGETAATAAETTEQRAKDNPPVAGDKKSREWIAESSGGWTAANSKDLTMGALHLLFGSPGPDKQVKVS